ncbi:MAG: hypothetical protein H0V39_03485 [Nitrosomonas sp.]|nr:hypothetical protein [Nitrosomonas sp.]
MMPLIDTRKESFGLKNELNIKLWIYQHLEVRLQLYKNALVRSMKTITVQESILAAANHNIG